MPTDSNPVLSNPSVPQEVGEATKTALNTDTSEYAEETVTHSDGGDSEGFKEVLHPHDTLIAQDDLARSERRYRRLFEAARAGILLLDVETGRITDANPYVYELLLRPGDTLLMATDGITEARCVERTANYDPILLEYEGMLTLARRNRTVSSLREMSQEILTEARAFGGSFRHDVCLLLARCP